MTTNRCRLLSVLLVVILLGTMLPAGLFAAAEGSHGKVTSSSVHVRKKASPSAEIWFDFPNGFVCTVLEELDAEGVHWFKVETTRPDSPGSKNTYVGFVNGDFFRRLTAEEEAEWQRQQEQASYTPTPGPGGQSQDMPAQPGSIGVVTNGGTNLREGPSIHTRSQLKLDRGAEVELITIPSVINTETFYKVRYQKTEGYIMSTFIRVVSGATVTPAPTATPSGEVTPTATAAGDATPTPTPAGDATPTPTPTGFGGYTHVRLILSSCHLRDKPNGSFDRDNDWEGQGSSLPLAGEPVTSGGYTWYPVRKGGKVYYVRNDCVQPYSDSSPTDVPTGLITPTPTPVPTTPSGVLGYVITTKGGCNLRATIGGTVIKQIPRNKELPYLLPPVKRNGYTWYFVDADGNRGYLRGDVVRVISKPTPTPTPVIPTATPDPGQPTAVPTATPEPTDSGIKGYVKTTAGGVNLRKKAGYTDTLGRVDRDVVLPYYGIETQSGISWYRVRHTTLGYGYLHGSYLMLTDEYGNPLTSPTTAAPTGTSGGSQQEASYKTLKLGSVGTAVRNLVTELKNQGFYSGSVTNRYTSEVEKAVRAFQSANNLTVDGIAGASTQHKLFGTVPIGAGDGSNLDITLYPAEKIDWYTGGINELWARGDNYKVYDVKTGIVWWAHRWAGGFHVDAEPLTAADTARLCKSYGVTTAQEIADRDLYQRRPLLVTIGTRTFACSLYGEPHNYPDGDTIKDNDFKGQLCIHFTNSRTHTGNKVDSGHEQAIQYAWEHAPNGHK